MFMIIPGKSGNSSKVKLILKHLKLKIQNLNKISELILISNCSIDKIFIRKFERINQDLFFFLIL